MASQTSNSKSPNQPASSHTSDPLLAPFIAPSFDPTAYLNSALPSLGIATAQQPIISSKSTSLPDLVSQTTTHLATLSAQEARLVETLTSLTDEILRSGSRLAYEVELLRGEAVSLEELLGNGATLEPDVRRFVPEKPAVKAADDAGTDVEPAQDESEKVDDGMNVEAATEDLSAIHLSPETSPVDPYAPPALARLRTLQHVRNSLQSVISTFDAALSFPLPPSLLNQSTSASSFVSVAAPADPAQEAAGQEALAQLRASILNHLDTGRGGEGGVEGVVAAERRLEELKDLCAVWKGTSEEKARAKVLDGWEKELDEAREKIGVKAGAVKRDQEVRRGQEAGKGGDAARESSRSRGLFGGLRRLGDKIYLD